MKSVCFFSSYYKDDSMPNYVRRYLKELSRHFSELVLLTNEKPISSADTDFLQSNHITWRLYKNEGYDFGMWHKAFAEFDVDKYDRIGLVNDSCILFASLDRFFTWADEHPSDYCGFTDNNARGYHIQSYFLIINKNAIPQMKKYFSEHGIFGNQKDIIEIYEIGLSRCLMNAGMKTDAFYSFKDKVSTGDPTIIKAKELIEKGFPLIKRRILARNYGDADYGHLVASGFDANPWNYIRLIKKVTRDSDTEKIFEGIAVKKSFLGEWKFRVICTAAGIYGRLKRINNCAG
ncbi:MAG: hypothetical protein HKL88_03935 [Bacteroidia bacterium]|jgi:lipopolysaccharide biosynthesis protein|nr:hypothetical protein [Bacteroidia bacterium]